MKITKNSLLFIVLLTFRTEAYFEKRLNRTDRIYNPIVSSFISVVAFPNDPCTGAKTR